jgi:hypothetical protein
MDEFRECACGMLWRSGGESVARKLFIWECMKIQAVIVNEISMVLIVVMPGMCVRTRTARSSELKERTPGSNVGTKSELVNG